MLIGWTAPSTGVINANWTFTEAGNPGLVGGDGVGYQLILGGATTPLQEFGSQTPLRTGLGTMSSSLSGLSVTAGEQLFWRIDSWGSAGLDDITQADITITETHFLTWSGTASSAWNTTDINWRSGSGPGVAYTDGQSVLFDDTAGSAGSKTVMISGSGVAPASVQFNNTAYNYTLQSSGGVGITGSASLIMAGSGSVFISGSNTYTGGTNLNAGAVVVDSVTTNLGSGALTFGGGTLKYSNSAAPETINSSISLAGNGNISTNGNTVTIASTISGGGNLTVTGPAH